MFTFHQVFDQIKQLATDQPDTVADCVYFDEHAQRPVCIVGHWLYQNDLLYEDEWEEMEEMNAHSVLAILHRKRGVQVDSEATAFLTNIQNIQDRGIPWGEALDAAIASQE